MGYSEELIYYTVFVAWNNDLLTQTSLQQKQQFFQNPRTLELLRCQLPEANEENEQR